MVIYFLYDFQKSVSYLIATRKTVTISYLKSQMRIYYGD